MEAWIVKRRVVKILSLLAVLLLMTVAVAGAEQMISTTVVMRVSHMTQSAVVNAGEDLTMEVSIGGVDPASYQWYFEGAPIEGANQKVYNLVNAQPEDAGVYRLDAFDADGKMLVSMDISARVIDTTVPQTGDGSLPVQAVLAVMGAALIGLVVAGRRWLTA